MIRFKCFKFKQILIKDTFWLVRALQAFAIRVLRHILQCYLYAITRLLTRSMINAIVLRTKARHLKFYRTAIYQNIVYQNSDKNLN